MSRRRSEALTQGIAADWLWVRHAGLDINFIPQLTFLPIQCHRRLDLPEHQRSRGQALRFSCAESWQRLRSSNHVPAEPPRQARQGVSDSELLYCWTLCSLAYRPRRSCRRLLLCLSGHERSRPQILFHNSSRGERSPASGDQYHRHVSERKHGVYTQHDITMV